ncbi:helix-turn-helix domain-containing protein [Paenibacillaceae bacterium WGS1546]|uniref:helix-turn-helix domain-containing protein n=1 Tax=Cohnella sp. WGS1546 TaxID=3366810 RepID=UPI00372D09CE
MQEHKLFFKILSYFISLLIPILLIGYIVYVNVDRLMSKDVSDRLQVNLRASVANIDVNLEMVRTTHNNLMINDIVQQYLKPHSLQTDQDKINVPSIIRTIAANRSTLSSFIDTVFLYGDAEKVYTADGVVDFATFFGKFYVFDHLPDASWKDRLKKDHIFEVLPPTDVRLSDGTRRTVIPEVTTQYVNGHLITSVTTIPARSILRALTSNSIYESTSYLVTDSDRRIMTRSGQLTEEQIEEIGTRFESEVGIDQLQTTIGGEKMVVTRLISPSFGWQYFSLTPVDAFNYESSGVLTMIVWICVALVVIGIVFSLIFSLRLYNPIRNIRSILQNEAHLPAPRDGTLPGGEFGEISQRIHELVEEKLDITERLQHISNDRVERYFRDLTNGSPWQDEDGSARIMADIGFTEGRYLCCCFMFRFRDRFYHEIAESDRVMILEKLKVVLWGIMRKHVNCYMVECEHNLYVCMVNLRTENDRAGVDEALRTIRLTFEYDMVYCDLLIGIGNAYPEAAALAASYSEAITALDKMRSRPDSPIVDAAELNIGHVYYYSFLDETKIVNALKIGEPELLKKEIETIVDANRSRGVSFSHLGSLLSAVYQTGYRYLTERKLDVFRFATEKQHRRLMQKSILPTEWQERTEELYAFFERIIEATAVKPERRSGNVVALISEYISLHYAKDLHLEMIADEIGLSPKYVSKLFKETTGSSITDTISRTRMEKAKQLLLETDLKIGEIAELTGIHSRTTFLRVFKKYEGISPMDYRNAHGRKDDGENATF